MSEAGKVPSQAQRIVFLKLIPENGQNDFGTEGVADPLFCENQVTCYGQCIGLVIAKEELIAAKAADYIAEKCIAYTSSEGEIILDLKEAILKKG